MYDVLPVQLSSSKRWPIPIKSLWWWDYIVRENRSCQVPHSNSNICCLCYSFLTRTFPHTLLPHCQRETLLLCQVLSKSDTGIRQPARLCAMLSPQSQLRWDNKTYHHRHRGLQKRNPTPGCWAVCLVTLKAAKWGWLSLYNSTEVLLHLDAGYERRKDHKYTRCHRWPNLSSLV